jgi:hypothetical protein
MDVVRLNGMSGNVKRARDRAPVKAFRTGSTAEPSACWKIQLGNGKNDEA